MKTGMQLTKAQPARSTSSRVPLGGLLRAHGQVRYYDLRSCPLERVRHIDDRLIRFGDLSLEIATDAIQRWPALDDDIARRKGGKQGRVVRRRQQRGREIAAHLGGAHIERRHNFHVGDVIAAEDDIHQAWRCRGGVRILVYVIPWTNEEAQFPTPRIATRTDFRRVGIKRVSFATRHLPCFGREQQSFRQERGGGATFPCGRSTKLHCAMRREATSFKPYAGRKITCVRNPTPCGNLEARLRAEDLRGRDDPDYRRCGF